MGVSLGDITLIDKMVTNFNFFYSHVHAKYAFIVHAKHIQAK